MRLLVDMNLTPRWVEHLNRAGHSCVHWSQIGSATAPDVEICAFARQHGYVLLTNDLDFPQILAHTGASGPSVILLRGEPLTPEARANSLLSGISECVGELEAGAILTVDWSDKARARLLPLS